MPPHASSMSLDDSPSSSACAWECEKSETDPQPETTTTKDGRQRRGESELTSLSFHSSIIPSSVSPPMTDPFLQLCIHGRHLLLRCVADEFAPQGCASLDVSWIACLQRSLHTVASCTAIVALNHQASHRVPRVACHVGGRRRRAHVLHVMRSSQEEQGHENRASHFIAGVMCLHERFFLPVRTAACCSLHSAASSVP